MRHWNNAFKWVEKLFSGQWYTLNGLGEDEFLSEWLVPGSGEVESSQIALPLLINFCIQPVISAHISAPSISFCVKEND